MQGTICGFLIVFKKFNRIKSGYIEKTDTLKRLTCIRTLQIEY
jgi:hypothetical protein